MQYIYLKVNLFALIGLSLLTGLISPSPVNANLAKEYAAPWEFENRGEEHHRYFNSTANSENALTSRYITLEVFDVIKGQVLDETETPIFGASVLVKGTTLGAITDMDGYFSLEITDPQEKFLVVSYIGFEQKEIKIGTQTDFVFKLSSSTTALGEIVVTALGFKQDADRLGATSSKIDGRALERSGEPGIINGLGGKASGVQISRSSGDPGAASFIQIRGQNTLTGNTDPLIVIDGIPISNTTNGGSSGGVVPQSRLNDINPNDIASMQVLKGASAAALWGSRAANGVILITTKKGLDSDKINISFSTTLSIDHINAFHPFQSSYGQGSRGVYNPTNANSYGDRIQDRSGGADNVATGGQFFESLSGNRYYPILQKNSTEEFTQSNYDAVFQTGHFIDNAISLSGGDEKNTFFFSVGDLRQQGIQRGNSEYNRTTVRLNAERKFNDYIRISGNSAYTYSFADRIQRGNNTAGAMLGLLRNPPDFDKRDYKGSYYSNPNASPILNRQRGYRSYLGSMVRPAYNDALWALYENENTTKVNRFINSFEMTISPLSWFDLTSRVGLDSYTDEDVRFVPIHDSSSNGTGFYQDQITKETEVNMDVIGRATTNLGSNFDLTYILGFNINNRNYKNIGGSSNSFLVGDAPPNFTNSTALNRTPFVTKREIRSTRVYSTANISAFGAVFLNVGGAAESASSFGELSERTFFYPSADIAWQFTRLPIFDEISVINFGKLRASYGIVGVQPQPYLSNTVFMAANFAASPWGDQLQGSQYGLGAFAQGEIQGDPSLRPERKTEYEIGADLRFFQNRFRTGFTYYYNNVEDLLVPVTLPPSTGFAAKYTNAATLENRGIELDMGFDVLDQDKFSLSLNGNLTRNRNKVLDLAGTQSLNLGGGIANFMDSRAVVGYPVGVFWSSRYARNEDGSISLNTNGFPIADPVDGVVGDPNPDFIAGFGTDFRYKNFSINILFETSQGGDFYSGTRGVMYSFGTHGDLGNQVTLSQDTRNYAGEVIPAGTTLRGNLQDFGAGPVLLDESWYTTLGSGFGSLKEQFVEDGSWTRLRHVVLSYRLNSEAFKRFTKLESADFSLTGRNLLLWTNVVGIDPDTNLTNNPSGRNMDYFNSPNTRSYLFSLKINY